MEYALTSMPTLWFYDRTESGIARTLRNDLSGNLTGEVQFVQSHSVAPSDNSARELPAPVALREALLLLLGDGALASADAASDTLAVTASRQGVSLGTLRMRPPALLPRSDSGAHARPDVGYSSKAWSVILPWQWMRPGLQLSFTFAKSTGETTNGILASNKIDFGAPAELVIQNIRLGMLTTPNQSVGYLMKNPERGGTDYFSTIPISRLVVAQYQDMQLDRVIVSTGGGAIYTTTSPSPQTGGVYSGDMRQDVAKVQVAQGINLANFGLVDSIINEDSPESFSQRVVHHARGLYSNGVQEHGLSGGNGMVTLLDSVGNEFSHEMGHSYGLGHYPGYSTNPKNPVHHADSGWGYIGWRQRMMGNLSWAKSFDSRGTENSPSVFYPFNFAGVYNFNADAMSGGRPASEFSQYTHHTGYSAQRIQTYLNTARSGGPRAVPDVSFASGWRGWNAATGEWVDRSSLAPAFSAPRPSAVGVPVVTLLGGYHTSTPSLNLIYPGFFGNWGVVYEDLPSPSVSGAACWLEITFDNGPATRLALTETSPTDPPRKFHANIAASRNPRNAALICRSVAGVTSTLAQQSIVAPVTPLPAAIDVGQAKGMSALRNIELAQLDAALATKPAGMALTMAQEQSLLQWRDDLSTMTAPSQAWASSWLERRNKALALNSHVTRHPDLKNSGADAAAVTKLRELSVLMGLLDGTGRVIKPLTASLALQSNGLCLLVENGNTENPTLGSRTAQNCNGAVEQQWWIDFAGRVHNALRPDQCLSTDGGWYTPITLETCQVVSKGQIFVQRPSGRLEAVNFDNRSIEALPALIGSNTETSKNRWLALPQDQSDAWTLLSADVQLALFRQFGQ